MISYYVSIWHPIEAMVGPFLTPESADLWVEHEVEDDDAVVTPSDVILPEERSRMMTVDQFRIACAREYALRTTTARGCVVISFDTTTGAVALTEASPQSIACGADIQRLLEAEAAAIDPEATPDPYTLVAEGRLPDHCVWCVLVGDEGRSAVFCHTAWPGVLASSEPLTRPDGDTPYGRY